MSADRTWVFAGHIKRQEFAGDGSFLEGIVAGEVQARNFTEAFERAQDYCQQHLGTGKVEMRKVAEKRGEAKT